MHTGEEIIFIGLFDFSFQFLLEEIGILQIIPKILNVQI